jgi:ATP-binding cassette subfamily C protein
MDLPRPKETLTIEAVGINPPGTNRIVVQGVAFQLKAGQGLGVIGPSASGKSSLVRAIVGVWPALQGKIRIDGAAIDQWTPETLGPHIGYLPQDMELFAGSVAENIARFEPDAPAEKVIAAARAASVHELILGLPNGYETPVGDSGNSLSAGQRQRIGLARALYGDPFLVVLDEPNSNIDREGDEALTKAILGVRARGGIVVVVCHRPSALAGVDMVLVMLNGRQQAFGPKEQVLQPPQQQQPATTPAARMLQPMTVHAGGRPQEKAP